MNENNGKALSVIKFLLNSPTNKNNTDNTNNTSNTNKNTTKTFTFPATSTNAPSPVNPKLQSEKELSPKGRPPSGSPHKGLVKTDKTDKNDKNDRNDRNDKTRPENPPSARGDPHSDPKRDPDGRPEGRPEERTDGRAQYSTPASLGIPWCPVSPSSGKSPLGRGFHQLGEISFGLFQAYFGYFLSFLSLF